MSTGARILLAAVGQNNVTNFPIPVIQKLWELRLLSAKKNLAVTAGIRLSGVSIHPILGSPQHRDFSEWSAARGFPIPCGQSYRFIVSDNGWDTLPTVVTNNPLLVAIDLQKADGYLGPHPLDVDVAHTGATVKTVANHLADFLLDISFANSYLPAKIIQGTLGPTGTLKELFRKKVIFAHQAGHLAEETAPYVSFSALARKSDKFGTEAHLDAFVRLWDEFMLRVISGAQISREQMARTILNYPSYRNQLPERPLLRILEDAPQGICHLVVQKRSMEARTNPKLRNKLDALLTGLDSRGSGGRKFGLSFGDDPPLHAAELAASDAIYLTRVYLGAK
ncbi:hypothetical protein [Szabonella alba]|uniref:Uncharacterized protein n=1 Tax=Szabonella alba TaxID=2804194 RepID=A0A8K0Y0T5_9RHOB|nr:hypothetical protein [Szabonella alba]MBL4918555.1 hypothetical protein [Szabonella alba]